MASNLVKSTNIYVKIPMRINDKVKRAWQEFVEEKVQEDLLVDITCHIYSTFVDDLDDQTTKCCCGRLARSHSFVGEAQTQYVAETQFDEMTMAFIREKKPLTVYGRLGIFGNNARFIRCYSGLENTSETLSDLVIKDVDSKPDLLISCFGGAENFAMTDKLEKEFMSGISRAAVTKGVWLLTTGLNQGVSKLIGQSVHRFTLLNKNSSKPTIIGLTSWGTLTEHTQKVLKYQTSRDVDHMDLIQWQREDSSKSLNWNEHNTLDKYHSHFLLLDNGRMNVYLDDRPRSDFVQAMCSKTKCHSITIIIEGGFNTVEVIRNDLKSKRPIVIIHGSGRLSNVLGTLLEISSKKNTLENADVEQQIALFFPERDRKRDEHQMQDIIDGIKEVLKVEYRNYLNIFKLERDTSLTDTIIKAMDKVQSNSEQQRNFLRLAVSWNYVHRTQNMPKHLEDDQTLHPSLFQQALEENRPVFVDFFLRRYYNPLTTTAYIEYMKSFENNGGRLRSYSSIDESRQKQSEPSILTEEKLRVACALSLIIDKLYQSLEASSDHWVIPKTVKELNENYMDLIGPYAKSLYFQQSVSDQLRLTFKELFQRTHTHERDDKSSTRCDAEKLCRRYHIDKPFDKQEMLRELFLWSVYAGYSDIAFVLLLQLESRISAALIAACIARRLSLFAIKLDLRRTFEHQTKDYEEYARACITACYKHNERLACQLLVRENLLFGDVTCMQIAIASRNIPFINTICFNEVLDRGWRGQLAGNTSESSNSAVKFLVSLLTLGLTAPCLMKYRRVNTNNRINQDNPESNNGTGQRSRRWTGIEDQMVQSPNYWQKLLYFHSAPVVKIFYHFVIYVWFLLVFSYVILFGMKRDENLFHWTKIYLIITVSAMLLEDFCQFVVNRYTQMVEKKRDKSRAWTLPFRAIAYILFYTGIICHFQSTNRPSLFTVARMILAIDLELWFLFSLRFVSAFRLLGPKLFMIQNMARDLLAFIYIIFVCIVTYGVVSRALTFYTTLDFTPKSILMVIFYRPYWFLYSVVDDEKKTLDDIFSNATTSEEVSGAVVSYILLAFHMLITNILILNLLIAVFNFSINDVQEKNEFFWRYQRYELICEYFQKIIFAYPPFSFLAYIGWLINVLVFRGTTFRLFKYLRYHPEMDNRWTEFENAATYEHAHNFVEEHYRFKDKITFSTLQEQIHSLKDENERIRSDTDEIKNRLTTSMERIMHAIDHINSSTT